MSRTGVGGDSLQHWLGRTELVAANHGDEFLLAVNEVTEFGRSTMRIIGRRSNFVTKDFVAVPRSLPVTVSVIWSEETVTADRTTNHAQAHFAFEINTGTPPRGPPCQCDFTHRNR